MKLKIRIDGRIMVVRPYVYFRTPDRGIVSPNIFRIAEAGYQDGSEISATELFQMQKFWEGVARDWRQRMLYRTMSGSGGAEMVVGGFAPGEDTET